MRPKKDYVLLPNGIKLRVEYYQGHWYFHLGPISLDPSIVKSRSKPRRQ